MKSLYIHAGALGVAGLLAFAVWSREPSEGLESSNEKVEVWGGSPETIEAIRFDSPQRTVVIEPKKDDQGRYYVTRVEKDEGGAHDASSVDAGAPAPGKRTTMRFIGVKAAEDLAKQIAPLMAFRRIGPIEPKRAEEFGLDKPEGTLKVKIRGVEHSLVIGGTTPGGQERYAKEGSSGAVYAVTGEIAQNMIGAESRLLERDLHGFEMLDVTRVRVTKGQKAREIAALPEKKGGWADPASPTKLDETAGNWMSKLERLHVVEYVETPNPPLRAQDVVLRVDYLAGSKPLGFLELYKVPGEKGSDYLVKSERIRWAAKVLTSAAEQVDQDASSVLK
jgi:uncharacterized protein DUF4340